PELAFLRARGLLAHDGVSWSKPASLDFQVTHLLSFLACTEAELQEADASPPQSPAPAGSAVRVDRAGVGAAVAQVEALADAGAKSVLLDLEQRLDASEAQELLAAAGRRRLEVD